VTPPQAPLRVVVADDHPYYRKGLVSSLRVHGIDVVAEAPNGEAAIRAVQQTTPDVVVMDLKMPGMSGLEATRQLTSRAPETRVLVLSVSAEEADVTDAFLAGAACYVLKDRPVHEVVDGIRAAASGHSHVSSQVAMRLLRGLRQRLGGDAYVSGLQLAGHEQALLALVADGRADHEIADTLGISDDDLRAQAAGILAKLEPERRLRSRTG
jgi:DNA-binding NarL/FixJ family response regulator